MRKWKRLLLCLCAVLAAGVLLIFWASRGRTKTAVSLSFVGFTNIPIQMTSADKEFFGEDIFMPMALLRATNRGSVPVYLDLIIRPENLWNDQNLDPHFSKGFWPPATTGLPHLLKPGENSIIEVSPISASEWWSEIYYQRRGPWERAYGWVWEHSSSPIRRTVLRVIPGPKDFWAKAGPFTNQPPPASVTIHKVHEFPSVPVDYRFGSPQFPPNNVDLIQTKP